MSGWEIKLKNLHQGTDIVVSLGDQIPIMMAGGGVEPHLFYEVRRVNDGGHPAETRTIKTPKSDSVNHPAHYQTPSGIEAIDVIEAFDLPHKLGDATKYILRAGRKDSAKTVEDLQKAVWYIQRHIWCLLKPNREIPIHGMGPEPLPFDEWRKLEASR